MLTLKKQFGYESLVTYKSLYTYTAKKNEIELDMHHC